MFFALLTTSILLFFSWPYFPFAQFVLFILRGGGGSGGGRCV